MSCALSSGSGGPGFLLPGRLLSRPVLPEAPPAWFRAPDRFFPRPGSFFVRLSPAALHVSVPRRRFCLPRGVPRFCPAAGICLILSAA